MCEKGCRATRDMDTRVSTPLLKHFKERIACGDLRKEGKMGERQRKSRGRKKLKAEEAEVSNGNKFLSGGAASILSQFFVRHSEQ